ncbi:MAG: glycosyltransferase family 2 protein [Verrucomicrobia bacterium]|nr:glycosyltransferase family 2 protein [Verrucomicrobiota bacterium]
MTQPDTAVDGLSGAIIRPEISIVIPFLNEEENILGVLSEIRTVLPHAEIIAVDDGSKDLTWNRIQEFGDCVGIRLSENRGQSAAIYAGLLEASGQYCGLMDGDGQNDPVGFLELLQAAKDGKADVICGFRANRKDKWSRRIASKFANGIRRVFLDDGIRDTGCSMKVFSRECVELLVPFDGLHRYLPAIYKQAGLSLMEVSVRHRPRAQGVSKYTNFGRAIKGFFDLFGVRWLLKRKIVYPEIEKTKGSSNH